MKPLTFKKFVKRTVAKTKNRSRTRIRLHSQKLLDSKLVRRVTRKPVGWVTRKMRIRSVRQTLLGRTQEQFDTYVRSIDLENQALRSRLLRTIREKLFTMGKKEVLKGTGISEITRTLDLLESLRKTRIELYKQYKSARKYGVEIKRTGYDPDRQQSGIHYEKVSDTDAVIMRGSIREWDQQIRLLKEELAERQAK